VADIYAFYSFCLEKYTDETMRLSRLARSAKEVPNEYLEDDRYRLELVRRQFGYAIIILLCSTLEDALRGMVKKARSPQNFLEKYLDLHRNLFGTDFSAGVEPSPPTPGDRMWLPVDSDVDLPMIEKIDIGVLLDFVWARNKIVHYGGYATTRELSEHPTVCVEPPRDMDEPPLGRQRILVRAKYVERVVQHVLAFFHRAMSDWRSKEG
jgi:hypothetical protein